MRRSLVILAIILITTVRFSSGVYAQELDALLKMSIGDLGRIEVVTSTKSASTLEKAPSVLTVITAEDIREQGLRSLNDVLMRVPGFFTLNGKPMNKISSRGFSQDHNSNILLLIDGHSMNSINVFGVYNQHLFPTLSKVKQIEIIRGPGSTLWGSDAASGVINIITKDPEDLGESDGIGDFEVSYSHESTNDIHSGNLLYGKRFGDKGSLFLSYTNMRSDGKWNRIFDRLGWAMPLWNQGTVDANSEWDQSHELYMKAGYGKLRLSGGYLDLKSVHPERSRFDGTNTSDGVWQHNWVEVEHDKQFSERYALVSKAFYDHYNIETVPRDVGRNSVTSHWIWRDRGFGGEVVLHRNTENSRVKLGLRYSRREEGPDELLRYRSGIRLTQTPTAHEGVDETQAVFLEGEYSGLDRFVFTLGGRFDKNNYRDDSTIFIPRGAIFYQTTPSTSLKYTFNTGYIRPSVRQSRGGDNFQNPISGRWEIGADMSQQANMHDLQFAWNTERSLLNLTLFHSVIEDNIIFVGVTGRTTVTRENYMLTQVNTNDLKSQGAELEFRVSLLPDLSIYGNYAYADAEYDKSELTLSNELIEDVTVDLSTRSFIMKPDLTRTGAPEHLWNIGLVWKPFSWASLNLHYRGWDKIWVKWNTRQEFEEYGPEHFFDLSLNISKLFTKHLELSVTAFNVLGNDNQMPNMSGRGYLETTGALWNIQLRMKF